MELSHDGPSQRGVPGEGELRAGGWLERLQGPPSQDRAAGTERQPSGTFTPGQHRRQTLRSGLQTLPAPAEDLTQEG